MIFVFVSTGASRQILRVSVSNLEGLVNISPLVAIVGHPEQLTHADFLQALGPPEDQRGSPHWKSVSDVKIQMSPVSCFIVDEAHTTHDVR